MSALALSDIRVALGDRVLVDGLDMTVAPGTVATVMGPSGSGKSTLLALIGGFLDRRVFTASGGIAIGGTAIGGLPPERRRIGLLFQDDLLFPHLDVAGNLMFGLPADVAGRAARQARVAEALAAADLADFGGRDPATLSGGQRARVALMRVLLSEPRALLLDEPFSKLDSDLRGQFRRFVFGEIARRGLPALMVTHDKADAEAAGGPVLSL